MLWYSSTQSGTPNISDSPNNRIATTEDFNNVQKLGKDKVGAFEKIDKILYTLCFYKIQAYQKETERKIKW